MKYFKWKDLSAGLYIFKSIEMWLYILAVIMGFYLGHTMVFEYTGLTWGEVYDLGSSEALSAFLMCVALLIAIMLIFITFTVIDGLLHFFINPICRYYKRNK